MSSTRKSKHGSSESSGRLSYRTSLELHISSRGAIKWATVGDELIVSERNRCVQVERIGIDTTRLLFCTIERKRFRRLVRSQSSGMAEILSSMKLPTRDTI